MAMVNSLLLFILTLGQGVDLPASEAHSRAILMRLLTRNLALDSIAPSDSRYESSLRVKADFEDNMWHVRIGNHAHCGIFQGNITSFTDSNDRAVGANPLTEAQARDAAMEVLTILGQNRGELEFREIRDQRDHWNLVIMRSFFGHRCFGACAMDISRDKGQLQWVANFDNLDHSFLRPPRITAAEATAIALAEYGQNDPFAVARFSAPTLGCGIPPVTEAYRSRVAQSVRSAAHSQRRALGYYVFTIAQYIDGQVGEAHGVYVDSQNGAILGQIRMAPMGPGPAPKIQSPASWADFKPLKVVGHGEIGGSVESSVAFKPPAKSLKQFLLRCGDWVVQAQFDAKAGLLWRKGNDGKLQAGKPAPAFLKGLRKLAK